MRALVYLGPRSLELRDAEIPPLRPDEVLIRVEASGICGSDLHGYLGKSRKRVPPLVMGHEVAGRVEALGRAVGDLAPGATAAVYPLLTCGTCAACRRGDTSQCSSRRVIGIDRPGGYAEYVAVPRASVVPLPPGLPALAGSLAEPLANAVHIFNRHVHGVGRRIAIFGAGTQGLMALHLAGLVAPAFVACVDLVPARLAVATRLGATLALDARADDVVGRIRAATGGEGVDVAIEAAGASAARQAAVACVRTGGRVVLLGLGEEVTPFDAVDIVNREVSVHGSYAYTYDDFVQAVELLRSRRVGAEQWVRPFPLEDGPALFHRLVADPGDLVKAVLTPARASR